MTNNPFTLEQAEEIADDFEDLTDTGFQKDGQKWIIKRIEVCHFGNTDKSLYPLQLEDDSNNNAAMPEASGFDVSITLQADSEQLFLSSIDIRTYAAMMGVKYKFPSQ